MPQFVNKTAVVLIDAVPFNPKHQPYPDGFVPWTISDLNPRDGSRGYIQTLEGRKHVASGWWIITYVDGSKDTCCDLVFRTIYDPLPAEPVEPIGSNLTPPSVNQEPTMEQSIRRLVREEIAQFLSRLTLNV